MALNRFINARITAIFRSIASQRLRAIAKSLCIILALNVNTPLSIAASFSDHQIKAVFLFNFASFVRWPKEAFADDTSPLVFCATNAQSPTVTTLLSVIEGESVNSHRLILKAPFQPEELASCHILFLQKADLADYQNQLPHLSATTLLTVSDTPNFLASGGLIELSQHQTKIQPTINTSQLERSKLTISSTLLRLATIYRMPSEGARP